MSAMAPPTGGEWVEQDGAVIARRRKGPQENAHVQSRWRERAPPEWQHLNVRVAWREGEVRHATPDGTVVRHHEESGMSIIAEFGILQTAYRSGGQPDE